LYKRTKQNQLTHPETYNDLAIAEACCNGNRLAQRQFYERYKHKMFGLCQRFASNRMEAEDLLQEGFVRVFRDLPDYRGTGSLEGWVRKTILRVALDHARTQQASFSFMLPDELERLLGGESMPHQAEDDHPRRLIQLLQQLPVGFRTVLNLYAVEGYTHEQIARELGIAVGTSKSQLLRAKEYFKKLFEQSLSV
jgi:RNA polymerase sigma factor (sigma-70 family)